MNNYYFLDGLRQGSNWLKDYIIPLTTFVLGLLFPLLINNINRKMNIKDKKSDWVKQHVTEEIITFIDDQLTLMQDLYWRNVEYKKNQNIEKQNIFDEIKISNQNWIDQFNMYRSKADCIQARIDIYEDPTLSDLFRKYTDKFTEFRASINDDEEIKDLFEIKEEALDLATEIYKIFFKK